MKLILNSIVKVFRDHGVKVYFDNNEKGLLVCTTEKLPNKSQCMLSLMKKDADYYLDYESASLPSTITQTIDKTDLIFKIVQKCMDFGVNLAVQAEVSNRFTLSGHGFFKHRSGFFYLKPSDFTRDQHLAAIQSKT